MNLFGENSSIHGVKYVFTQAQVKSTRIFWCCALLFSLSGFLYNILNAYKKWQFEPQIEMKSRDRNSSEFPLPAVTLCSNLFAKNNSVNFIDIFTNYLNRKDSNLTDTQCELFTANLHWCQSNFGRIAYAVCPERDLTNIDTINLIDKSALGVKEAFYLCRDGRCADIIFRSFTDFGICYSSNLLGSKAIYDYEIIHDDFKIPLSTLDIFEEFELSWTPEKGFINQSASVPIRAERGTSMTFHPVLNEIDKENICSLQTFRIYFHKPNEIVTPFHESVNVNYEDFMEFHIFPTSHRTDEVLKGFAPEIRKCYFEGERKLRFFKTYTKALCEWECKTNKTLELCGCVKFSMPRDKFTEICNITRLSCLSEVPNINCNCLAPCIDVKYSYKVDRTRFNRRLYAANLPEEYTMSWVDVSVETEIVEEIENFVSYKFSNFISDFGGLLGLFMGCSLLSVVEIFYFLVYGAVCRVAKPNDITPDVEKSNEKWAVKKIDVEKNKLDERNAVIFGRENNLKNNFEKKSFKVVSEKILMQNEARNKILM